MRREKGGGWRWVVVVGVDEKGEGRRVFQIIRVKIKQNFALRWLIES